MPRTKSEEKKKRAIEKFYGKRKGQQVYYASENKARKGKK